MANEKPLFNENADNEDKKHPIMKEEDVDFVDFSAAFDGEDDEDEALEEFDEEFERSRSIPPVLRGLSFLKRKRDFDEDFSDEEDEEKEEIQPVKEEKEEITEEPKPEKKKKSKKDKKKNKKEKPSVVEETEKPESQDVVDFEASISDAEETEENIEENKPEKKKGFSLFTKKEERIETPVEEEAEDEIVEEKPIQQEVSEVIEIFEESEEDPDEIVLIIDNDGYYDDDDEDIAEPDLIEIPQEETEIVEKKEEIEEFSPFEITVEEESEVAEAEEVIEEPEAVEDVEEQKSEKKFARFAFLNKRQRVIPPSKVEPVETAKEATAEELEIELLPSFEETEVKEEEVIEEIPIFEEQEEIKEIPTFEEQEEIKEIPPFDKQEEIKEIPTFEEQEEIKEIPPFEETVTENVMAEPVAEVVEEAKPKKKKKEKKAKKVDWADESGEKPTVEPMTMKDHMTFILIILALLLTIVFIVLKFIPLGNNDQQNTEADVIASENVSEIEIRRKGIAGHLIQSDIDNVFYAYSEDYSLTFYQSDDNGMKEIKPAGSVNAIADVNNGKISVKVDYVEVEGQLFGAGLFRKTNSQGNYLHDMVVFKLVNLPEGYDADKKALLLATSNSEAVSQSCNVWEDSFIVDLESGKTTKFISNNGNMYLSYSILTNEGYESTNGKIPFFTTRDYDATTNKKDIYLKDGNKETRFAKDVAGSFVYVNGDTVSYLKSADDSFNAVRNGNGKETLIFSLDNKSSYLYHNEYLLDKYNGILYNVKTGRKTAVTGYGMSNPEMMTVSDDGRYLVVLGTVNSAIDYQVHIFDLEKNEYAKYADDNFSNHKNLVFVGNATIVYSVVEPNQGCEYVMLDVSKAFK